MAQGTLPFEPYSGDNQWAIYSRDGLEIGPLRLGFRWMSGQASPSPIGFDRSVVSINLKPLFRKEKCDAYDDIDMYLQI